MENHNFDDKLLIPPQILLENSKELIKSGNNLFFRAAVLEAITALEIFINEMVFKFIDKNYSKNIAEQIEKKTRFRFDERMDWVLELATGKNLKKEDKLWQQYQTIKKIRNKISHTGRKATLEEANSAYKIVGSILGYLLVNIEISNFFKEFENNISIQHNSFISIENEVSKFIRNKFEPFLNKFNKFQKFNNPFFDFYYIAGDYQFGLELKSFKRQIKKSDLQHLSKKYNELIKSFKLYKVFLIILLPAKNELPQFENNEKIEFVFLNVF